MTIHITTVLPSDLERLAPALSSLLIETVNGGAPLGFLTPITREQAGDYWLSLRPDLDAGTRLLFVAFTRDGPAGSGQLVLSPAPNGRHRAELQKLFVSRSLRGRGVGRSLLAALHGAARRRRRTLLVLNTRRGDRAETFYKRLGYREVGVLPGWSVGPAGERYDHVALYRQLAL
jgi:acetyltransferase